MKSRKIIVSIIICMVIIFFVAAYLFVMQKRENEELELQANREKQMIQKPTEEKSCADVSDEETYGKAIEITDKEICICIKNNELKKTCDAVVRDVVFYKKSLVDMDVNICEDIKDQIAKDSCVGVVKSGTEYVKNNKAKPVTKKGMTLADYEKTRKENPNDVENLLALAMIYSKEGFVGDEGQIDKSKLGKAFAVIEAAKKIDPNNAKIYSTEGYVLRLSSRNDSALAAYAKSLQLDENNIEALKGRAGIYGMQGKFEEAIADLEKAAAQDKDKKNREIYANLCSMQAKNSNREKAILNCNIIINSGDSEEVRNEAKSILESLK